MKISCTGSTLVISLLILGSTSKAQENPGVFFEWRSIYDAPDPNSPRFTPMPLPGFLKPGLETYYGTLFTNQVAAGHPTGFVLREAAAPVTGEATGMASYPGSPPRKNSLDDMLAWVPALNYVIADFENGVSLNEQDMTAMVSKVRAHTAPSVNAAYVGNYSYWFGTTDLSMPSPSQTDRTAAHNAYVNSAANIALPPCYGYTSYNRHSQEFTTWPAGQRSPDRRSAMFYAQLERFSGAKRNLPANHKLIPFVAVYIPTQGYWAPIPEKVDTLALIQHYRMRGADGIFRYNTADYIDPDPNTVDANNDVSYKWTTDSAVSTLSLPTQYRGTYFIPHESWLYSYTAAQHRADIVDKWDDLDDMFGAPIRTILNLSTTKTTGVEWSGVRSLNTVKILVSNLSGTAQSVDLTPTEYARNNGLPSTTGGVSAGTHQMFTYTITNLLGNSTFDSDTSGWYLQAGSTRDLTGGVGGTPCLRMQNSAIGTTGMQNCRTEPGAKMSFTVTARGASSPLMKLGYYRFDSSGTNLGYTHVADFANLPSTYNTYTATANIPTTTPAIKYIRPVIHNYNAPTDSNDVIWADNVVVKFEP